VTRRPRSLTGPVRRVTRRAGITAVIVSGAGYLAAAAAARGVPERAERRLFLAVNGPRDRVLLRVPQQLGTPWVLPGVAAIAFTLGRRRLGAAAVLALPVEKGCEVLTKEIVARPRPGRVLPTDLHDDAPTDGASYPSGHAAIASCAVVLVAPYLPTVVLAPLCLAAAVTAGTRIHQGAHFPLDAAGGVLLGIAIGSATTTMAGALADMLSR
jgi:membrane-associated phospholipid phosphatase